MPRACLLQGSKIDSVEESLTGAEQDGRDSEMDFVNEALAKILLDDVDPASKSHILALGSFTGALQSDGGAFLHQTLQPGQQPILRGLD